MAGTADDVMKMLEVYNGQPGLLEPETVAMALANQIGDLPRRASDAGKRFSFLGAVLQDPQATVGEPEEYLIELSPGETRWIKEDEKWELRRVRLIPTDGSSR